jgi:trigger factor
MDVKQIKHDGLVYEIEITVPANDIDARVDARLKEVGKTMKMPGFRPGKVPLAMMKKRYGRAVMGEVLEQTVNETSTKAISDKKLRPAIQPKIEVKDFDEGKDLTYAMTIEVLPEIKIADFKGLKLEKPKAQHQKDEVDKTLENLAGNMTSTKPIEGKRAAKDGDTVLIDFDGRTADDNVHQDGMKAEGHKLKLGSGQFIPGFEDQLMGKKAGDNVEVKVTFPENYGAEDLAGRAAIFEVTIHEIHEDAEAEINDDFAKNFGMDKLDDLKKAIGEQLQAELDGQSRMILKKDLLDQLDEIHSVDVPPTMLEMEHRNILDQIELEQKRNPEAEQEELSDDDKAEFLEIAGRRVRLGLILSEIGRQNNINVSDQELQQAVIAEAQKYPGQEREVFDYYAKNRDALEAMRAPLFEEKVVDYIVELAEITEKDVTGEELLALLEDDGSSSKGDDTPQKKTKTAAKKTSKKKSTAKKSTAKKKTTTKKKTTAKKEQ